MNVVWGLLTKFAPRVTLPIAIVVGAVGYAIESKLRDSKNQSEESFSDKREERRLMELTQTDVTQVPKVTENRYSKSSVLNRQLSPSLSKDQQ